MTDFALARRNMVDGQLRPNRVTNAELLAAIGDLPRERFLPDSAAFGGLCRRRRAAGQRPLPDGTHGSGAADPDASAAARTGPWWLWPAGLWRRPFGTAREIRRGGRKRPGLAAAAEQTAKDLGPHRHPTTRQAGAGRRRLRRPTTSS